MVAYLSNLREMHEEYLGDVELVDAKSIAGATKIQGGLKLVCQLLNLPLLIENAAQNKKFREEHEKKMREAEENSSILDLGFDKEN